MILESRTEAAFEVARAANTGGGIGGRMVAVFFRRAGRAEPRVFFRCHDVEREIAFEGYQTRDRALEAARVAMRSLRVGVAARIARFAMVPHVGPDAAEHAANSALAAVALDLDAGGAEPTGEGLVEGFEVALHAFARAHARKPITGAAQWAATITRSAEQAARAGALAIEGWTWR